MGVRRKEGQKVEKIQVTSFRPKRLNTFLLNTKFTCFGEQPVVRGSVPSLSVPILAGLSHLAEMACGLTCPRPSGFELK